MWPWKKQVIVAPSAASVLAKRTECGELVWEKISDKSGARASGKSLLQEWASCRASESSGREWSVGQFMAEAYLLLDGNRTSDFATANKDTTSLWNAVLKQYEEKVLLPERTRLSAEALQIAQSAE